jgi:hypothetical protein
MRFPSYLTTQVNERNAAGIPFRGGSMARVTIDGGGRGLSRREMRRFKPSRSTAQLQRAVLSQAVGTLKHR